MSLLDYNRIELSLPNSPQAYWGSMVHNLFEEAIKGKFKNNQEILSYFEKVIFELEEKIIKDPLESHFVPLDKNIPNFQLKKISLMRAIENINPGKNQNRGSNGSSRWETEAWIENSDKTVGGIIDLIKQNSEGLEVIDYKTGEIFDRESKEIKEIYSNQLKIYAALIKDSRGSWPRRLILMDLYNNEFEIDFGEEECMDIFNEALTLRKEINNLLESEGEINDLANPSKDNCKYCSHRPICNKYNLREENYENINDFSGEIIEKVNLQNGLFRICLLVGDKKINIRGLSLGRHDFLKGNSKRISIYNLSKDIIENSYVESLFTTSYICD